MFWGSTLHVTPTSGFVDLSRRGRRSLMVYESPEQALGLRPRTQGGVSHGLALTSFGIVGTQLYFSLTSLLTLGGHLALSHVGLFSPHVGRGMSTITTRS